MGKGTIISGGTDGQYQVQINYARDKYTYMLSELEAKITEYESKISTKQSEIDVLYIGIGSLTNVAYNARMNEIQKKGVEKNTLTLIKLSFEKRKQYLESHMPDDETISAWCADLTEDITGEVGLIEIPGESEDFNIQPGYDGNAAYSSTRDGQLAPTVAQTSAQTFYNLAMLPGWQKWMPTYRYGTITAIDGDKADVALEATTSSQQSININQADTLSDVDIEYMDCNGLVFAVGDDVLIQFVGQKFDAPKIIGFKTEPKPCVTYIAIKPLFNDYNAVKGRQVLKLTVTNIEEEEKNIEGTVFGTENPSSAPELNGCCVFSLAESGSLAADAEISLKLKGGCYSVLYYYDDDHYVQWIDQSIAITLSDAEIVTIGDENYYFFETQVSFTDLYLIKYSPDFEDNSSGPFMGPESPLDPTFDAFSLEAYFNITETPYSSFVSLYKWEGLATEQVGYVIRSWPYDSWMPYSKYLNADDSNILADVIYDGIEKGKILYFPGVATCWNVSCQQVDFVNVNCADETCLIVAYEDDELEYFFRNFYSVRNCLNYTTTFYPGFSNETVDTVITSDENGENPVYTDKTDSALIAKNTYKQISDGPWELYHIYSVSLTFTAEKWLADDTWW